MTNRPKIGGIYKETKYPQNILKIVKITEYSIFYKWLGAGFDEEDIFDINKRDFGLVFCPANKLSRLLYTDDQTLNT